MAPNAGRTQAGGARLRQASPSRGGRVCQVELNASTDSVRGEVKCYPEQRRAKKKTRQFVSGMDRRWWGWSVMSVTPVTPFSLQRLRLDVHNCRLWVGVVFLS